MSRRVTNREARQAIIDIAEELYWLIKAFPGEKSFATSGPLLQAAISVLSSIAGGKSRFSREETSYFVEQSKEFLGTVEAQLSHACRLGYLDARQLQSILDKAARADRFLNPPDRVSPFIALAKTSSAWRSSSRDRIRD